MSRRKSNRKRLKQKKVYSIIVDGECEQWYLQLMKKHENLRDIRIVPELPSRKRLKDLYNLVKEKINENYDKVIWILDFDTIITESQMTPKGKKSKIQEFKKYISKLKKYKNLFVLVVNTPCLEFWYLLHFKKTNKFYRECKEVIKEPKKEGIFSDYEKSEKFYKRYSGDIYKKLKPYLPSAIKNAKELGEFEFDNIESAKAEMYKIFEILGINIKYLPS